MQEIKKRENKKVNKVFQKRLMENLIKNKEVFLNHMKQEWEAIEKGARREQLFREAKEAALVSSKTLLKLIAISGICTAALVAPKVFVIASSLGKYKKYYNEKKNKTRILLSQASKIY